MAVTVQVEGLKELRSLLRKIGDKELQKQLRQSHKAVAALVVARAKSTVPVQTGKLRSSIRAGGTQSAAVVRAGNARAPYGSTMNWGRKRGNVGSPPGNRKGENVVQGTQFLTKAGESVAPLALVVYQRDIEHLLNQVSAR